MNQMQLQSLIVLIWTSEWTFVYKRSVTNELLKQLDDLE